MIPQARTLVRGRLRTLDPERPEVDALLLAGGRVVALGASALSASVDESIALGTSELAIPAFSDPHVHLMSAAAARASLDCSEWSDLRSLLDSVSAAAAARPTGAWIRAVGYDDAGLAERRHPTRLELDAAAGGRPVVLHHATGHAAVLSSAALAHVGAEVRGDGLRVDCHDLLARVPRLDDGALARGFRDLASELLGAGVVAVTDATHTNTPESLRALDGLLAAEARSLEVSAMLGWDRTGGLRAGERVGRVRVGAAKVMPAVEGPVLCASGARAPLSEAVAAARSEGFNVAVHVVDFDILEETLTALERTPCLPGTRDRIEHCALALPEQLERLARLPVEVVTQPSFVVQRARKYREQLSEAEQGCLYPVASLLARGVPLRFSSDAPVVPPVPLQWVRAAVDRELSPEEAVDVETALRLASVGPLTEGGDGRLVVLSESGADARVVSVLGVSPGVDGSRGTAC